MTGVFTVALSVPVEHSHLSSSIGGVVGLVSSFGNIGPLIVAAVFGLLIDVKGTFHASLFAVAVLFGITLILSSSLNKSFNEPS